MTDMNNIVREDLYIALNELLEKQFEEFKWRLKYIDYDEKSNIPPASLEKANQQELVDLMIQYYEEDALKVCICVLRKSNVNDVAKKLEETLQKDVEAHQLPDSSDYRSHVKKKFQRLEDPNSIPGEYVPLNQRYSNLIILDYPRSEEEREHEIMATGRKHAEIISKRAESSMSIETLFSPDKYGLTPQVVVLQGAAGIGKTTMAKKIMFDWASQQLYQDKFNYIFYISCREMNLHADSEKSSIAGIISKQCPNSHAVKNVIQSILKNVEKLLFIIDGFDELRYSFDQPGGYFCTDPWKKEPVRILLSSLFQKKLLPESYLIITTRPTALKKLHGCLEHPRYFEILGFSPKERQEYFNRFFENAERAYHTLRLIRQNDTLFSMCVIPLLSWIICTVMKQEMERGQDLQKMPYTLTAVYMLYLSSLLKFHHKASNQDFQINVKGLCSLAAEGIWKQEILFMEEDVKKHNLDQEDSLPLFLNQSIFKRDIGCIQTYSFIHLSFQEFFAALFYVLEEGEEQPSENLSKNLQTLLEQSLSSRFDLTMTVRFLFGFLSEEKRMTQLKQEFGWKIPPKNKEFLLDCVKTICKKLKSNSPLWNEVFNFFYELQDDSFLKNSLEDVILLNFLCQSVWDFIILAYCIQHCNSLNVLEVDRPDFLYFKPPVKQFQYCDERMVQKYVALLFKGLISVGNLRKLSISTWSLNESSCRHLAEFLRKNHKLRELCLPWCNISDKGLKLLCEELKHPDCELEVLQLSWETLTVSSSRHLADVLRKNQRLVELHLSFHDCVRHERREEAFQLLCEGLKDPDCKLDTLRIPAVSLTESCCRHLAQVFKENQNLRELDLFHCDIGDKEKELLYEGLKHPACKLEKLLVNEKCVVLNHREKASIGITEMMSSFIHKVFRMNK